MKRVQLIALLSGLSLAGTLQASPSFIPTGSNITFGHTSNAQSIHAYTNNPAMGASALKDGEGDFKLGIFGLSAGAEFGPVDNIETLIDNLSQNFDSTTVNAANPDPDIQKIVDSFNSSLAEMDKNGYFKVSTNVKALSPLVIATDALGGALVFDFSVSATVKTQVLHEPIYFTNSTDAADDINYDPLIDPNTISLNNGSSVLGSIAAIGEFAIGYSRPVLSNENSDLYAGVRAKALRVGLVREAVQLASTNNNSSDTFSNFDASDVQSKLTADFGLLYTSDHYRVGATLNNLTSPSFEYNNIDFTNWISNPNSPYYNNVRNRLSQSQSFTMKRQLIAEAAWYSQSRNWVINGSYDVNAVEDPFGDDYKWIVSSAAYASDSFWIPGVRFGLRKNMTGSRLSYLDFGTTLFSFLDIDASMSNQKVEVDGSSYPRSFYVSIGTSINF